VTHDIEPLHRHVLSLLDEVGAGGAVLDLGCGEGDHLRMLAEQLPADARLVGVDLSEKRVQAARDAADGDPRFTFVAHDLADGIPFETGTFDRVLSVNVLEAIEDKDALLREVHRVLRPEGRLVFAHLDWDSLFYDGADKSLVRRVVHAAADWKLGWMADSDAWMGRRLWGTFQRTGLFEGRIDARVHTSTTYEPGCYGWQWAQDFEGLVRRGMIDGDEYQRFVAGLEELATGEGYFFAITMFSYVGRKA
jgi:SAM-dependent methyltransferase